MQYAQQPLRKHFAADCPADLDTSSSFVPRSSGHTSAVFTSWASSSKRRRLRSTCDRWVPDDRGTNRGRPSRSDSQLRSACAIAAELLHQKRKDIAIAAMVRGLACRCRIRRSRRTIPQHGKWGCAPLWTASARSSTRSARRAQLRSRGQYHCVSVMWAAPIRGKLWQMPST